MTKVAAALGIAPAELREGRPGELALELGAAALPAMVDRIAVGLAGRLVSLLATDEREASGRFVLRHVWSLPAERTFLHLAVPVDPGAPSFPSIAARYPAANWFEREVMDFFGLTPDGHPNPARVAMHDDWPERAWPLRKDFPDAGAVPRTPGRFPPVPAGDRRGRVPGAGRSGPRRDHRARTLPLWSRRRAGAVPPAPAVLRAQGDREAVRAPAVAARDLPRRIDFRRHVGGPRAGLGARDRAAGPA